MLSPKPEDLLAHELSCPICFQLYSDPVALPCGHNYCRDCIHKAMQANRKGASTCPECRSEFQGVECLQKNFKLCGIIQSYKAISTPLDLKQEKAEHNIVKVSCDYCVDEPALAVKTCLTCDMSLCSRHLQRHQEKKGFSSHSVVEPVDVLGGKGCSIHGQLLEYFCSNDMACLCTTCILEGHHENHDVLTLGIAEVEMRRALESNVKVVTGRLQMTEQLLQKTLEHQGGSEAVADKVYKKAVTVMDSMAALVERYKERLEQLQEQERLQHRQSQQCRVTALEQQQQQLLEVQKGATEALAEKDSKAFIQGFMMIEKKLRDNVTGNIAPQVPANAPLNTKTLQAGLKTQDFRSEMTRLMESLHVLLNPLELTFNVCTAHPSLVVSNDWRTVKYNPVKQLYIEHSERFTSAPQILCHQSFTSGEHIWVVEVGPTTMWSLGLCYKSIPRRGDHSRLGHNSVSWRLQWKNHKLTVCQSSSNIAIGKVTVQPIRIEIALDYEGGTLMFHSIKGHREHLHTFKTVFKERVYPAFSILSNNSESWITFQSGM
ncbi:E3 ubiquitin/ISG15 ligase TRIM25 [Gouania willdenowi]|uniref:E3 ubiquitin/ISG15 ligase TRIM25 n=1 Tax=Gouania willdenowi TaxID=441366 RepID=UPI001054E7A8|nr:E3 ubiquitin/ISG15 ligase TRIM25-like [Gouania willdenowi]